MGKAGRPRNFDRQEALVKAMHLFWAHGYEGTTLSDLLEAMGNITPTSFYAAFGSKEQLFREAIALNTSTHGAPMVRGLTESNTAREAIAAMLHAAADSFTCPDHPHGCILVLGAMNCARGHAPIQAHLRELRLLTWQTILERLQRGVKEGDLSSASDLPGLASFYTTVLHGLSIQARDGASRKVLHAVVEHALAAWDATSSPRRKGSPAKRRR